MSSVLDVRNLNKSYGDFCLNGLNFKLEKGYVMGFIGPNGSGKSTTIKSIMNLIKKDSGSISVFGMDNVKDERKIKEKIGFVYDENIFYGMLTINEMKNIIAGFYRRWDENKFKEYIKHFELNPNKVIDKLSKGMKIKFALALALSHGAELIVMDEPTSGLDPAFRSELMDILYNVIQNEEMSIFFSTHITADLEKIADYITFINKGSMVFSESKEEVLQKYAIVKGSSKLLDLNVRKEFIGIRETASGFEALTNNKEKARILFNDSCKIEKASLEDIMVYTIRGDIHV
ncbi:ABC transporter ATP-binding protein [Clostridium estertheticum]|uniref:Sodium ABC transporter ATP-binding protein n=1 Tax=Clostridium estertheticum subsp. estertheticum TaxID=1552 RepID=A0A1J0GHN5_9CLOT|nr:ABC transporter ATP-binding protein [Clostridium estertheticum]APC40837.1 sodium ABC transporter ATP-binding protein [Clostridium estertheticum subsp. estertheticum]MBU3184267.1 ABC transporter ATP-binding protein [Clostridium estertheticum]MBZ9617307.1 ABC transporter ATP-binding protein [Clostridium estertheticum subsp. laramiense]WAG72996.1 ABC transporter ATP-binding protein [Clostridium estertheticum]